MPKHQWHWVNGPDLGFDQQPLGVVNFGGSSTIGPDPGRGIDGASETDGLDAVSAPLGAKFPAGLLVVQDGRNLSPREKQNFKFVSWRDVAAALGIE